MINDEVKFAKILEDIKYTAKNQGNVISRDDVYGAFEELDLSKEQMDMVFDYLKSHKIGIDEPVNADELLSEDDRNLLEEYKAEIESLAEITPDKKRAYTMSAMAGDNEAKEMLINAYLPQVLEIAKLYTSQGVMVEDLIGEGNLALAEGMNMLGALEEPDEVEGMLIKLIMDAMEGIIKDTLDEEKTDEKIASRVNEVAEKAAALAKEYGRKVTVNELIDETGLGKKKVIDAIKLSSKNIEDIDYSDYEDEID